MRAFKVSLSTIAVLLAVALCALASIAAALPGACHCATNHYTVDVASCDTTECHDYCFNHAGTTGWTCKPKPQAQRALATAQSDSETAPVITETEAFMVQKAMLAIPCDLCEVTVADVQKIPEASCATALDNACKVVQAKFPQVKCSNLLETLACGVVRTLLNSQTPAQICTQVAKCQASDVNAMALASALELDSSRSTVVANVAAAASAAGGVAYTCKCNGSYQPAFYKDTCTFAQCDPNECRARFPDACSGTFTNVKISC